MPSQYPTSLDTTTTLSTAVNGLQTTLNGDHTSGATTITVASTSGAASAGYVYVDSEVVKYAGVTPTTLTGCTRGADGTAQAAHNNGAVVKFGLVADHHNSLVTGLIAVQTKLGLNTNGASASSIDAAQLASGSTASITGLILSGNATISGNASVTGTLGVTGKSTLGRTIITGALPVISGVNAGISGTTITGSSDNRMIISFTTTGTPPGVNADLFTVSFNVAYVTEPSIVPSVITRTDTGDFTSTVTIKLPSAGGFTVRSNAGLGATLTYKVCILVFSAS